MKAIIYEQYGSADVLQLKDVPKPVPQANEILVKIHAASANALDWHMMRADPFLARFENGLFRPKETRLGADIAGTVEAVGSAVTQFHPGDAVFGDNFQRGLGAFAEYVCVNEDVLVLKPPHISFESAAAVPTAALTALQGLRHGDIRAGQSMLINGASGGVGTFAIQLARSFGAEVTGVCSARNLEMVRSIGADHVIDYTNRDFTADGERYDLIYCAVGNRSIADYLRALKPGGVCVIAGFTTIRVLFQHLVFGPRRGKAAGKRFGIMPTVAPNKQDLLFIQQRLADGDITPVIDRCYTLQETPDAIRYLETGRARGKIVITVDHKK